METVLGWIGVIVGAAGAATGVLAEGSRAREDGERVSLTAPVIASFIGVLVVFFLTRPVTPPFSIGQQLGYGALIGGVLGILASFFLVRSRIEDAPLGGLWAVIAPSIALFGAALVLLVFRGDPNWALGGFAIGATIPAVIFRLAVADSDAVDLWVLSSLILGATVLLAQIKYDTITGRIWWLAPIMVLVAAVVSHLIGTAFARRERSDAIPALIAAVITLGLTAVFAWKVFPDWGLFQVAAAGVITFALIGWLAQFQSDSSAAPAAIVLLVVALSVAAWRTMAGFGIGIALLAAWSTLLPASARSRDGSEQPRSSGVLTRAMFIGLGLLLLRLFMENYADQLRGMDLHTHYTLMALAIGAVFPFLLTSFFALADNRKPTLRVLGAGIAGLFAASIPLVIILVWGFKPLLGFLIGTIAAMFFLLLSRAEAADGKFRDRLDLAVLSTTAQVSAVFLAGVVAPLSEETRGVRIIWLAGVLVAALIWAGVSALIARRTAGEG